MGKGLVHKQAQLIPLYHYKKIIVVKLLNNLGIQEKKPRQNRLRIW